MSKLVSIGVGLLLLCSFRVVPAAALSAPAGDVGPRGVFPALHTAVGAAF